MSGDYSRIAFDPWDDDLGVLLQQGRPLSDAEWNALALQLRRRMQVDTLDTIGAAVVPLQTPDAFELSLSGGNLGIGRGRMYVDGLLAENHGSGDKAWDPRLEEEIGSAPVFYVAQPADPDSGQPYYPNPPALPTSGRHLVYLDVWTREVGYLVRPGLIEKAIGIDSTTRLQTVWQVKLLEVGADVGCATPLDSIKGWLPAHAPSAARLSTGTVPVPGEPDPCLVPPGSGYKGLENQLYRIEIHAGGGLGSATFKWSRDNASVETRVTHIPALNQLTVESTGKDSVLRFSDGDWIEITDDWRELHNEPGELRRIKIGNGVDDATRTILLEQPLPAGLFPTDAQDRTQAGRHTRIKRWDQRGKVLDQDGNVLQDLDLAAATGEITVPASGAISVLLEHDIVATFSLDPAGGEMKSGDAWVFAARSTDASIEELDAAPPRAIHHHYAKLGFATFPSGIGDCRIFWPPPAGDGGGEKVDNCACTVCVTPEQHAANAPSIQQAIDKVVAAGGGTICLQVGHYALREPLKIVGATSLRIVGKGWNTELASDAAVFAPIEKCRDIGLSRFTALSRKGGGNGFAAILLREVDSAQLEQLRISVEGDGAGIAMEGALSDISIRDNAIEAFVGIASNGSTDGAGAGLMDLRIEDNLFDCGECAIVLPDVSVHHAVSRIANNQASNCRKAGFVLSGASTEGFGVDICGNSLQVMGDGMQLGIDGARVGDNNLSVLKQDNDKTVAIRIVKGLAGDKGIRGLQLVGNRTLNFGGGIEIGTPVANAMIRGNEISGGRQGIYTLEGIRSREMSVVGNQLLQIAGDALRLETFPMDDTRARLAVNGNQIEANQPKPAVQLACREGDVAFVDNQCVHLGAKEDPSVFIAANTIIAASNRVTAQGKASMLLQPAAARTPNCTVVGNITTGAIFVGNLGTPLPAPWQPLNLMGI